MAYQQLVAPAIEPITLADAKLDAAHPLRLMLRSRFHPNQRVTVTYTRGGASAQLQLTLAAQHPTCV